MKAYYYKRSHVSPPYVLQWSINGLVYTDTFSTLAELKKYAKSMDAELCKAE